MREGKQLADEEIEKSLYLRAKGYAHKETKVFNNDGTIITKDIVKHYPPDTNAAKFWLSNRKPDKWKDRTSVEHEAGESLQPKTDPVDVKTRLERLKQREKEEEQIIDVESDEKTSK